MLEILLISAGAVLETLFIMRSYKRRDASSVVLKTMASVVFVLLGLLELRRMGPSLYGWYVVAGLTLGMLGDLLLALRFLSEKLHRLFFAAGSVSFFLGHIVYILAILALCRRRGCTRSPSRWWRWARPASTHMPRRCARAKLRRSACFISAAFCS